MPGVGPGPLSPPPQSQMPREGSSRAQSPFCKAGSSTLAPGREQAQGSLAGEGCGGLQVREGPVGSRVGPRGCVPLTEEPLAPFGPGGPCGERGQSVISEQAAPSPPDTRF